MKNNIKLPAKASIWYMASGLLGKACAVLTTPFFTRILTREEYGSFNLYMTVLGGASVICSAFSTGSAVYKGLSNFKDNKEGYIKAVLCNSICFCSLICIVLFAFSSFFGINNLLLPIISLQLFCDTILGVFYSYDRFRYKYKEVCALSVIGYIFPPISALAILWFFGGGTGIRIFTLLLVSFGSAIFAVYRLLRSTSPSEKGMASYALKQSLPLLPHSVSNAFIAQTDKLIITATLGAAALAEYSVAHSIGISLAFLVVTLGGALNPWIIRRLEWKQYSDVSKINSMVFSGLSSAALFVSAVAPEAVAILAPKEYSNAAGAVLPISLSILPTFLISTITVGLIYANKGKLTISLSIIGAALCVILNYMFIPLFGYVGAGIALLLSQTVTAVAGVYYIQRIGLGEIFSIPSICQHSALALGLGIIIRLAHPSPAFRVLLLIIPAVVMLNSIFGLKRMVYEKSLPA